MIIEEAKARLVQLDEDLELFDEMGIPAGQRLNGKLNSIRQAIADLKALLNQKPFSSTDEEIEFFKHVKPQFIARHLFAMDVFTIEAGKPVDTAEVVKSYFEQELKYIRKYYDQNKFMHQYYVLDGTELDGLLFVRNVQPPSSLIPDVQGFDPQFSTAGDYIFARFITNERIQDFLTDRLYSPQEAEALSGISKRRVTLKWTGEAINLAEMAYGIWLTGQVNNGNAGISEIMGWLEINFQVTIGRPFRRWQSISGRKRVSHVKYIDQMKAAILKRLDDENA
ncbi:RteC domain-containing protein [Mucilaginibacter sabulilitoris]|uniref:RteC domain-containing protein n=1 Tax=Mucilaginibacter sabulilitoris TaxID=1173583 RepID=A0ABZ0TXG0_9SPHI|nr:RteC domain-containing protein [Mucilaginibacter sabulilitoris]WPU96499.1 RteC domain-containing protein [Mucilaginibacter sabulilitoris]